MTGIQAMDNPLGEWNGRKQFEQPAPRSYYATLKIKGHGRLTLTGCSLALSASASCSSTTTVVVIAIFFVVSSLTFSGRLAEGAADVFPAGMKHS